MLQSYLLSIRDFIRNKWVGATLLMSVVFLLVNYLLLTGKAVGIWDADDQFMPYQVLLADHIRYGRLLIWDCWSNAGVSLSGDPQVGAFSPINLLLGFICGGSTYSFIVLWLTIWWLGGFGVLLLGRYFNVPVWAALIVALQYLFVGLYITNAEHSSWIVGFSFIPFIIWRLDASFSSNSAMAGLQSGALWGLSALSSYPGFTISTALFCSLWALGRFGFFSKTSATSLKTGILILLCWLLSGIAVLSPTYFSFLYDGAGMTSRVGALSKEAVLTVNPLPFGALSSFSSPFLSIQRFNNPDLWADTDISMTSIYAGILPFLALFAIVNKRPTRRKWCLLFLALLALSLSLSNVLPFRAWLYDVVYPTRFFKHSSLFRAYYLFSITVLALFGLRDLSEIIKDKEKRFTGRRTLIMSIVVSSIALVVFSYCICSLSNVSDDKMLAYFQLAVVWGGTYLVSFLLILQLKNAGKLIPVLLVLIVLIDVMCTYRISRPIMMSENSEMLSRWKQMDEQHSSKIDLTENGFYRQEASCADNRSDCAHYNNDQMIKKVPVFGSYTTQFNQFHSEMLDIPLLKKTAFGTNRIWFSSDAIPMTPDMEDFSIFADRVKHSDSIPMVIHTPSQMLGESEAGTIAVAGDKDIEKKRHQLSAAPSMKNINTRMIKYLPNELSFEVTADSDGWLLVTDRWARAWKVKVNQQASVVYGGNFIFRAIQVKRGLNTIHFFLRPTAFPFLIFISWGTLMFIFVISVKGLGKRSVLVNNKSL
jgi:hypothetical protein